MTAAAEPEVPGTVRVPVSVLVERRPGTTPWAEWSWRAVEVLEDAPDLPPWTVLREEAGRTLFLAGRAEVAASEVKNGWHEYLDRVSRGGEEIVITRYGKPIARLAPVEPAEPAAPRKPLFGSMAGTVTIHGDIIEPIDVEWEACA